MLSVNTNLSSLIAQSSMKSSTDLLNLAIERMTTGYKINHAKDNAANYSIATNMTTKISAYQVAEDNCAMGLDMLTTATEGLNSISNKLTRLRDLTIQAGNGTYGAQSLNAINAEANALVDEINRLYNTAEYNGIRLFGEPVSTLTTSSIDDTPAVYSLRSAEPMMFAMTRTTSEPATSSYEGVDMVALTDEVTTFTSGTIYSIDNVAQLQRLADLVNSGVDSTGATFVLTSDIDLSSIENWTPIGDYSTTSSYQFKGTFDGNGHVIKNLKIDRDKNYQGLFGYTASGSEIKNVGLVGGSVKGKEYVGGLVADSRGSITNSYTTVNVTGTDNTVGGLAGWLGSSSSISNSYATGDVTGKTYVGGLVGNAYSIISNSFSTGDVTGEYYVGGLAGVATSISNSYATGNVTGTNEKAGGLAGQATSINNSYATGTVTGSTYVGGLTGWLSSLVNDSYATGDVTGGSYVGGLAGRPGTNTSINNSYATGNVTGRSSVGGLAGSYYSSSSISNSAAVQTDSKATVMTVEQIQTTYTPESMGFTEENGWTIINETPLQSWQKEAQVTPTPPGGGTGGTIITAGTIGLQVGINSSNSSQIALNFSFSLVGVDDLRMIGLDTTTDFMSTIDEMLETVSAKQTEYGAVQNRLESALEEISTQYENLVSSRSTIRDADIAEVSSRYIQQQILQQASATLLATANQSPAIALQLI